ncbi:hypothetical protein JHK87_033567 [Glycine soja]|nr:hypothetical protein JHK87_033567 [Glycine soja]
MKSNEESTVVLTTHPFEGNLEELENNNSDVSLAFHRLYICLKLKLLMSRAAKATCVHAYEDAMKEMRKENKRAFKYLWKNHPARMARDHLFEVILITQLEDKFTMNLQTQE